eukprot:2147587-Amphidinium_carterae.1
MSFFFLTGGGCISRLLLPAGSVWDLLLLDVAAAGCCSGCVAASKGFPSIRPYFGKQSAGMRYCFNTSTSLGENGDVGCCRWAPDTPWGQGDPHYPVW